MERVCKSQQQQEEAKAIIDQPEEEELFVASYFATQNSTESWLIDSGCTNHMTHDISMFKKLDQTHISKVKIGNGDYIEVKGKGNVAINSSSGMKYIDDVLYVPKINQNLLSVGQLLEKGYKVLFEDKNCTIKDIEGQDVFKIQMKGKSFALNFMEEEQVAIHMEENNASIVHEMLDDKEVNVFNFNQHVDEVESKVYVSNLEESLSYMVQTRNEEFLATMNPQDIVVSKKYAARPIKLSKPFVLTTNKSMDELIKNIAKQKFKRIGVYSSRAKEECWMNGSLS